ncbi:MAG: TonB system transport protein ExbD [Sulfurimonas sp. RIFOXYD12_FULL_33_39]|uniref:ExbD/TolR family protein n=1 Tax=unclassified Sulfurimonas TaxID=2623549 RepID=UPI0008C8F53F|nr:MULTISPECIES: biopolymer transporter ExbD [unclassified Sulfurimonas]OHE09342.1 MAG: TonB system transport protein ExbD [Sulfurimonas sp. RIFOXYD12_FULL_33_39]OHE12875.1 MAG: TonB system transport protein ExbD [Sulfurimonas sp. RIFOXYD2_FULL_34_21]DAB28408.1 MAG TPA: TonB system transport protein ExbD [Sulfurimonas sp. UBA10385]
MQIKKFDSINVVPFIDIMLVLLVIVLTTATFVAKGLIPVDLPSSKSATKDDKKNLTITIKQNGDILFDKTLIFVKDIEAELCKYKTDMPIYINCDKDAKFDFFVILLDTLKEKNFTNLGIITKKD